MSTCQNLCSPAQRHPEVQVRVSVFREAYKQLNIKEPRRDRLQNKVAAMPDTGAMMCLVGMNTMHSMELREPDLVDVDMKIKAAKNRSISLLGGIFLNLELNGKSSKQQAYVTNEVHCLFLSQKASRDLCIVDDNFPNQVAKGTAVDDENETGKNWRPWESRRRCQQREEGTSSEEIDRGIDSGSNSVTNA